MCLYNGLKQTVLNSWYVKATGVRRSVKTGVNPGGAIAPPKTGVPNHSLTMYPFSIPTDEYVPLQHFTR